ncbi:S66 peptidase family protein [Pedobacter sp.]|uniref:S66 peptidase family protein n=1 Tax=Pedobacter sp. TaxID=1411316 RepID=UPI003D7F3658
MIKQPAYLKKGDKIAIVSPAKKLPKKIDQAVALFQQWGLEVIIGESVYADYHQFAGTDQLRTQDIQNFLDDTSVKAIIAARGGYGTIRIIDELDFTVFRESPKWIVGFSDITVLLSHLFSAENTQSIHAQMPYTFEEATPDSLESLRKALFGEPLHYEYTSTFKNRAGKAEGILIGGNLTLLAMVQGSVSEMDYTDKILFLEDVGEGEASIDRMMRMLKRSGKLAKLKGLIVGAFNELEVEKIPFGQTPEEVIWEVVKEYDYPVCFNFPTGHIDDNKAMVLGKIVKLSIDQHCISMDKF